LRRCIDGLEFAGTAAMPPLRSRHVIALTAFAAASAPLFGCAPCGEGDLVEPDRSVGFELRHQSQSQILAGPGSSAPTGLAISFDRATIPITGQAPPASASDLVLTAQAVGCHLDADNQRLCDQNVDVRLTVHDVKPGAATVVLDDQRATLEVDIADMVVPTGPCPDKMIPGVKCASAEDHARVKDTGLVAYRGIQGQLVVSALAVDCGHVLTYCLLQTSGTFALTAAGPKGEAVQLSSGAFMAADQRRARPPEACNQ
jgi:hypothetical protein